MDEFNRRLARADGLKAEPDPELGGAIDLVHPGGRRYRAGADAATADAKSGSAPSCANRTAITCP
jgi:hypothetical protein